MSPKRKRTRTMPTRTGNAQHTSYSRFMRMMSRCSLMFQQPGCKRQGRVIRRANGGYLNQDQWYTMSCPISIVCRRLTLYLQKNSLILLLHLKMAQRRSHWQLGCPGLVLRILPNWWLQSPIKLLHSSALTVWLLQRPQYQCQDCRQPLRNQHKHNACWGTKWPHFRWVPGGYGTGTEWFSVCQPSSGFHCSIRSKIKNMGWRVYRPLSLDQGI